MMQKSFAVLAFLGAFSLAGCRTVPQVVADYNAGIAAGRYADAAGEPAGLAAQGGGDCLMWRLMAARAFDLAGDSESALAHYDAAEDVMDANGRRSVFSQSLGTACAMMLNDRFFPYDGGGQDRIFTCLYKAIDYAACGRRDAARSELNRAAGHQENWLWERKKDLAAAQDRLDRESARYAREKGGGADAGQSSVIVGTVMRDASFASRLKTTLGFDLLTSGMLDKLRPADYQNPYAAHVTGVFRWINGDGGRNYLKDAAGLRPRNKVLDTDFRECDSELRPSGQVWVYVEDGLCPVREQCIIGLPLALVPGANDYLSNIRMALPRLVPRAAAAGRWSVGGRGMEVVADVDALAKVEYDVFMRGAIVREATRAVVDATLQVALAVMEARAISRKDWNDVVKYQASRHAAAVFDAGKCLADLRSWTSLPKKVYVTRVPRPAGGTIDIAADGVAVASVQVPPGCSMVFVRKPSPAAPCSVKVVSPTCQNARAETPMGREIRRAPARMQ